MLFFEILLDSIHLDWFLYDNGLRLESVKQELKLQKKIEWDAGSFFPQCHGAINFNWR